MIIYGVKNAQKKLKRESFKEKILLVDKLEVKIVEGATLKMK